MDRRILVSPDEEITLRRVALGIAKPQDLRAADLRHLFELHLVEHRAAGVRRRREGATVTSRSPRRPISPVPRDYRIGDRA